LEIVKKTASVNLEESFKQIAVKMTWSTKTDFDLAALYEMKDGEKGMVYFSEKGELNKRPFMQLSEDKGVGDTVAAGGRNEETMAITSIEETAKIHICVWDWGSVEKGEKARFEGSDVQVELKDDKGNSHIVKLDTGEIGNIVFIATIDNSGIIPKLTNTSKAGLLKNFTDSSQLWDILNA